MESDKTVEDEKDKDEDDDYYYYEEEHEEELLTEKEASSNKSSSFTCLTPNQIKEEMDNVVTRTNMILQLPLATVRALLNHFRWEMEKLHSEYFSEKYEDKTKLFKLANAVLPSNILTLPKVEPKDVLEVECGLCCELVHSSEIYGMACGHDFCQPCWKIYVTGKIMQEGVGNISCPECPLLLDDRIIEELVADANVAANYYKIVTKQYVETNKFIKWCPFPDCNNAMLYKEYEFEWQPVVCDCGFEFCFTCGIIWHAPINCEWFGKWKIEYDGKNDKSVLWLTINSKPCPKCAIPIQKTTGCNYMQCPNCNYHFCWMCLGKAHDHSYGNTCSRYKESLETEGKSKDLERNKETLRRYVFFLERYAIHKQCLENMKEIKKNVVNKMKELQEDKNCCIYDLQYLPKAIKVLSDCRNTIACSFAFAYYLKPTSQAEIFQNNLSDLEFYTEKFTKYLEQLMEFERDPEKVKRSVRDQLEYCSSRRLALLSHAMEGYENNIWKFTDNI